MRTQLELMALWQNATRADLDSAAKELKRREDDADTRDNTVRLNVFFHQDGRLEMCEIDIKKDEAGRLNEMLKHVLSGNKTSHKSEETNLEEALQGNKGSHNKSEEENEQQGFKWGSIKKLGFFFGPALLLYTAFWEKKEKNPPLGSVLHALKGHYLKPVREIMKEAREHARAGLILNCRFFTVIGNTYVELPSITLNPHDIVLLEGAHRAVLANSSRGNGNLKLFAVIDGKTCQVGVVQLNGAQTEILIAAYRSMVANANASAD